MNKLIRFPLAIIMSLIINAETKAFDSSVPEQIDESAYSEHMTNGLEAFYQTDWEKANLHFNAMKILDPDNPRGYFFSSMIPFWEYFFVEQYSETADRFMNESQVAITLGETKLESNPQDTMVIAMLSGLYGYQSLVASGENQIRNALRTGRTGFGYTRQLLEFDDSLPEASIGRGIYHYMVGSVPGALKWLVRLFGLKGEVDTGFNELKRAAESNSYVRTDAKMILAYLYEREENYDQSLTYLSELNDQYSRNVIFKYVYAGILEKTGKNERAMAEYEKVIEIENPNLRELTELSRNKRNILLNERMLSDINSI